MSRETRLADARASLIEQLETEVRAEAARLLRYGHPFEARPYTAQEYTLALRATHAAIQLRTMAKEH